MFSFLLSVALLGANPDYVDAYKESIEQGKPLVVTVGADWCPGCLEVKKRILPRVFKKLKRNKFCYAEVNSDDQPELASKLMHGGTIPQTMIYYKDGDTWKCIRYVGTDKVEEGVLDNLGKITGSQ